MGLPAHPTGKDDGSTRPTRARTPGAIGFVLDLFSSIRLGVVLLSILFVYSSIGSSGIPRSIFLLRPETWMNVREVFDLSEFEWFHTWPFNLLILLICVNLVTATLRRIPFNVVNLGVWMIHSGIIILCIGSVYYFATKVEGDTPIARRQVVAQIPGGEPMSITAMPGNRMDLVAGDRRYRMRIMGITPDWELLSGDDAGKRAYKVSMLVDNGRRTFIREMIAGYPQYTEDLVQSEDPAQPWVRAVRALDTRLVDEDLSLTLEFEPQEWFYLMDSRAVYLREIRDAEGREVRGPWIERPIERMPLWRDRVSSMSLIWSDPGAYLPTRGGIEVVVPAHAPNDPMPDVDVTLTDYVRYGELQSRRMPGGDTFGPAVQVTLASRQGQSRQFSLFALGTSPQAEELAGFMEFVWIHDESELERLTRIVSPALLVTLQGEDEPRRLTLSGAEEWRAIEGTDFQFRVREISDQLDFGTWSGSVAVVDLRDGEKEWTRWVFDDPSMSRDVPQGESISMHALPSGLDPRLDILYEPGVRSVIRLVAGPDRERLRLLVPDRPDSMSVRDIAESDRVPLREDLMLIIDGYSAQSRTDERPIIVPPHARQRDVGLLASLVRISVPLGERTEARWLPFHRYPFDGPERVLRRYPYRPIVVTLDDGREVEMIFSRKRMELPAPVVLEDFVVSSHIGGFTGSTQSIVNWESLLRFETPDGLSEPYQVSVNAPSEYRGFWYFQAQWDPPDQSRTELDPGSQGLNYTVLGVGNRNGVRVQLFGCCLSVLGMIYAFYAKPYIKRRRQLAVLQRLEAEGRLPAKKESHRAPAEPVEVVR